MTLINCHICGKVVGELKGGSKIEKGLSYLCKGCLPKVMGKPSSGDMPDFLRDLFK
jgi:DNA-directed RNA polymerase subunit RPC12/RpoP